MKKMKSITLSQKNQARLGAAIQLILCVCALSGAAKKEVRLFNKNLNKKQKQKAKLAKKAKK